LASGDKGRKPHPSSSTSTEAPRKSILLSTAAPVGKASVSTRHTSPDSTPPTNPANYSPCLTPPGEEQARPPCCQRPCPARGNQRPRHHSRRRPRPRLYHVTLRDDQGNIATHRDRLVHLQVGGAGVLAASALDVNERRSRSERRSAPPSTAARWRPNVNFAYLSGHLGEPPRWPLTAPKPR
jgi:hypothetical protein